MKSTCLKHLIMSTILMSAWSTTALSQDSSTEQETENVDESDESETEQETLASPDGSVEPEEEQGEADAGDDQAAADMKDLSDDSIEYAEPEETIGNSPVSIQVLLGHKWYEEAGYSQQLFNFTAEWYLFEDIPIKAGPLLTFSKLDDLQESFSSGQLLEFGLRVTGFWDFGRFTPYLSIDYVAISTGRINYEQSVGTLLQKGSLDYTVQGHDVLLGLQTLAWDQNYIILETTVNNGEKHKVSGTIGVYDSTNPTLGKIEISESETQKFTSFSLGILFEL